MKAAGFCCVASCAGQRVSPRWCCASSLCWPFAMFMPSRGQIPACATIRKKCPVDRHSPLRKPAIAVHSGRHGGRAAHGAGRGRNFGRGRCQGTAKITPAVSFGPAPDWFRNVEYFEERERGFDDSEDLFMPGVLEIALPPCRRADTCMWPPERNRAGEAAPPAVRAAAPMSSPGSGR